MLSSGYINNLAYLQLVYAMCCYQDDLNIPNEKHKINQRLTRRIESLKEKIKEFLHSKIKDKKDHKRLTDRAFKLLRITSVKIQDMQIQPEYFGLFIMLVRFYEMVDRQEFRIVSEKWIYETIDMLSHFEVCKLEEDNFKIANEICEELK